MKKKILNHSTRWITFAAILILGLSAGASLAEAKLFVPFWKSLDGNQFFSWYQDNKARLVAFYSPMQIWSAVMALLAAIVQWFSGWKGKGSMGVSALFAFSVLATFFLYFKAANAALAAGPMPDHQLQARLVTWEIWQWIRIGLATVAFGFAAVSASGYGNREKDETGFKA